MPRLTPLTSRRLLYLGVLAACFAVGTVAGWTTLAARVDHYAYDIMATMSPFKTKAESSVVVAIDEDTLHEKGGMRNIRPILTETLNAISVAKPKAVAIDVILADKGDEADDARLEAALRAAHNLVLPCEINGTKWEEPLPRFANAAAAIGHVHPEVDRQDGVSRELSLEEIADGPHGRARRWALALEAFRLTQGADIVESPLDLTVGKTVVPASRDFEGRPLLIRYRAAGIRTVSALKIAESAFALRGKTVFLGITALSAARDRLLNPHGQNIAGVEVHAHAFETLESANFLRRSGDGAVFCLSLFYAVAAGLIFAYLPGWRAYLAAIVFLAAAHYAPVFLFNHNLIVPLAGPAAVAWLTCGGAATYQHFFVRRQLRRSESEKSRYQQAIHWAAHEMRTPLTAIQGSSEIMTRYSLPEAKSKQLSEMIHSESKRLAKLIQTFLDVERLAEGHMELKREEFTAAALVATCLERVQPLAERKKIHVSLDSAVDGKLTGDRELMEYALYNLLTNAVKYSPTETRVSVVAENRDRELRLSVRDQGIGMDAKELKNIFQKFYRTKKAEQSGEVGTGIGLSIVEQIVTHHGGHMEVTSEPGKGSCFTMLLKIA